MIANCAHWFSTCATGWRALGSYDCYQLGLACPQTGGSASPPSSLDCVDQVCAGNNSFVDEIRHPSGISNWSGSAPEDYKSYCCDGE